MNDLFIYLIKAAVINAIILAFYYITFSKSNSFLLMRITLLFAMTLPLLVPLIPFPFEYQQYSSGLPILSIRLPETVISHTTNNYSVFNWIDSPRLLYYGVSLLLLLGMIISICAIIQKRIRSYKFLTSFGTVDLEGSVKSPFSFFSWVFLSPNDLTHPQLEMILKHEFCHVRQMHSIDRVLSGIFRSILWFSPFAHITSGLLSEVHEYQADSKVIKVFSKNAYSDLILSFYLNPNPSSISNNFSLHIKKRINMINNFNFRRLNFGRILTGICISLSLVFMTSMVTTTTKQPVKENRAYELPDANVSNTISTSLSILDNRPDTVRKVQQSNKTTDETEVTPAQYPGGDAARQKFIIENIVYPEDARKAGTEGTVFVQFIISPTGKITNAKVLKGVSLSIDKAALEVVNKMPDWIPARKDNKPVSFEMTIPFKFSLSNDKAEQGSKVSGAKNIGSKSANTPQKNEIRTVFTEVEEAPMFPGGDEARMKYMNENIKYPAEAVKKGLQGTVFVSFVIEPDGSITNAKVIRGIGGGLDEIALNAVKNMPDWIPGKVKGKSVPVQFNMPVKFKLTKDEEKSK